MSSSSSSWPSLWLSLLLGLCMVLGVVLLGETAAISTQDVQYDQDLYDANNAGTPMRNEVKRGGFRPVPFPCNGYDNVPRCQHNGRGPRKTLTKSGRFCVCLCPANWIGPECGYAANSLPGRRSFPWNWQKHEEEKRNGGYAFRDVIDDLYSDS